MEIDASYDKSYAVPFRQVRAGAAFFCGSMVWIKRSESVATANGTYEDREFCPGARVVVRRLEDVKRKLDGGREWDV